MWRPTVRIIGPLLRQIQAPGDRQTGMLVGGRQTDGNLTIVMMPSCPQYCHFNDDTRRDLAAAAVLAPLATRLRVGAAVHDAGLDHLAALRVVQPGVLVAPRRPASAPTLRSTGQRTAFQLGTRQISRMAGEDIPHRIVPVRVGGS
jgi:hypothetical protein